MEHQSIQMEQTPSPIPFYAKALVKRNQYTEGKDLPRIVCGMEDFTFPKDKLKAYRNAVRLPAGVDIPLFFPHSFLGPFHLFIMTQKDFPLKLLGSVHCRNHIIQYRPLTLNEKFSAKLAVMGQRRRPGGLEFDLSTDITSHGKLVWTSISTYLVRIKLNDQDPQSPLTETMSNLTRKEEFGSFDVPKGVGREYGMVTGDINPIHMSKILAKAFGFKKDLAHGMWSVGRGLDLFEHLDLKAPIRYDVAFKGPLFLGESVVAMRDPDVKGHFEYYGGKNDRPSVVGLVRNVSASEQLIPS